MAGQLIQRGERSWLVRVFVGRDPSTGKRKYHNKTIHGNKKDAQRYLNRVLRERDTDTFVEPSRETLGEYLQRWLEASAKPRVRERTYWDYRLLLARYIRPGLEHRRLSQLTPAEIQGLYGEMLARGLSSRTVRLTHSVLRSALEQAVRWGLLARNPAALVDLPRRERREMRAFSPAEASRFLEAAQENRWYALWMLLVTAGLRPGEALGLRWSDMDGNKVRVQRTLVRQDGAGWRLEEPKTDRSRRTVVLPDSMVRVLQQHRVRQAEEKLRAGPDYADLGLVFANRAGQPLDYRTVVRRHFKPLLRKADLPAIRPYDLRHTCATLLLTLGEHPKVVSERLGHSSITQTLDTYSHVLPDMQQQTAERLETLLFSRVAL